MTQPTDRPIHRIAFAALAALALATLAGCTAKKADDAPTPAAAATPAPAAATPPGALAGEIKVAGASDLVFAMEELAPAFTKQTGVEVTFIPGSSGKLAAQIKQGAPFDVFLSANVDFVDAAVAEGSCKGDTKALYAIGRLVMWTRDGGPELPPALGGLRDARFVKVAIAQPEHAPYGAAAKAALTTLGLWDAIAPKLVYGTNIKDTMQIAETGNAEVALIALALVKKGGGRYVEVPADLHPPIAQGMAVCKTENEPAARAFVEFMKAPATREILGGYGFGLPTP